MITLLTLIACDGGAAKVAVEPAPSRVEAVVAAPKKDTSVADLCELHDPPETAKTFSLPPLDGAPMARGTGWTWVNVWATWCEPCVEEMPMLLKWQDRLSKEGVDVTLQFLSADAQAADVAKYRAAHPTAPPTMRFASSDDLKAWLPSIGLDASATIPIHVLIDPNEKIRCVREGALEEPEYATIKKVLAGG